MSKVIEWMKANPKLTAVAWTVVAMIFGALTGWTLTARTAEPGESPGIIIVLPDDVPDVFGEPAGDLLFSKDGKQLKGEEGAKVVAREGAWVAGFSKDGKRALRLAGASLRERRAEREPLFAMLRDIHHDPDALTAYEQQAQVAPKMDPASVTVAVKIAIKVAIFVLERTADNTRTEWDNRLLALLKLFDQFPFLITPKGP